MSISRRRCAPGCRRSTTSTCGSKNACTCVRRRRRKFARAGPGPRENTATGNERYVVGLDVGTSKIAPIVGEMTDDGGLDIVGIGLAESKGDEPWVEVNRTAA